MPASSPLNQKIKLKKRPYKLSLYFDHHDCANRRLDLIAVDYVLLIRSNDLYKKIKKISKKKFNKKSSQNKFKKNSSKKSSKNEFNKKVQKSEKINLEKLQ